MPGPTVQEVEWRHCLEEILPLLSQVDYLVAGGRTEAVKRSLKKAEQSRKLEQYPDLFNAFETNFTLKQVPASRNTAKS